MRPLVSEPGDTALGGHENELAYPELDRFFHNPVRFFRGNQRLEENYLQRALPLNRRPGVDSHGTGGFAETDDAAPFESFTVKKCDPLPVFQSQCSAGVMSGLGGELKRFSGLQRPVKHF